MARPKPKKVTRAQTTAHSRISSALGSTNRPTTERQIKSCRNTCQCIQNYLHNEMISLVLHMSMKALNIARKHKKLQQVYMYPVCIFCNTRYFHSSYESVTKVFYRLYYLHLSLNLFLFTVNLV